jgi:hypothetical protein
MTFNFSIEDIKLQPLFTLYLIIAAGFVGELFGCRIRQFMAGNMLIKHLIGFLTLHFFITLASQSNNDDLDEETFRDNLLNSVFIYSIFIVSTRVKYQFFWVFILLLLGYYSIEIHNNKRKEIINKSSQSKENKEKEIYKINYLNNIKKYLLYGIIIVLLIGFLVYLGEKRIEYGDNFSFYRFIVGNPVCRNKAVDENFFKDLKYGLGLDKLVQEGGGGDNLGEMPKSNNMLDEL